MSHSAGGIINRVKFKPIGQADWQAQPIVDTNKIVCLILFRKGATFHCKCQSSSIANSLGLYRCEPASLDHAGVRVILRWFGSQGGPLPFVCSFGWNLNPLIPPARVPGRSKDSIGAVPSSHSHRRSNLRALPRRSLAIILRNGHHPAAQLSVIAVPHGWQSIRVMAAATLRFTGPSLLSLCGTSGRGTVGTMAAAVAAPLQPAMPVAASSCAATFAIDCTLSFGRAKFSTGANRCKRLGVAQSGVPAHLQHGHSPQSCRTATKPFPSISSNTSSGMGCTFWCITLAI